MCLFLNQDCGMRYYILMTSKVAIIYQQQVFHSATVYSIRPTLIRPIFPISPYILHNLVFLPFLAGASSPGGWSHSWLEAPCCAMSKCSPAFFSMAFCNISTTSVAAKLGCNAIRRTDHLKFPVPIMASAPVPPAWKILIQNKTVRQVLGKLASQSQFRGKLGS